MKLFFSFQWHLTDVCDQRCKHCYIFSENIGKKPDEMSRDEMDQTLRNCLDFCEYFERQPYFYLTGGDPILHPDFWYLLEKLHEKNIPFTILGNPFHLSPENIQRMKNLGLRQYQMSLDGLEKTHDWFRKPGSYRITLEKIPLLNEAGVKSTIMTTVSGMNIKEIPELVDEVVKAEVQLYAFARYCPTSEEKETGILPEEYREFLHILDQKFKAYEEQNVKTFFSKKDHLWTLYDSETGAFQFPENYDPEMIYAGCNCGNGHLTILPTGDVMACRRVQNSKIGNVFVDSLKDLWLGKMEEYREFKAFEKCGRCKLLSFCRGCPAVASGREGNFYAADPQCWMRIEEE